VNEFVDNFEYELALQVIVEALLDHGIPVSRADLDEMKSLASAVGLGGALWRDRWRSLERLDAKS